MSGMHHDVVLDFPQHMGRIEHLEGSNSQFALLFAQYREASAELHRIEAKLETPTQAYVDELKKRRLHLKDEIHTVLSTL